MRKGKFDSLAGIAASGTVGIIGIILIVLLIGGILLIAGGIWYGLFYLLSLLFPAVTFFQVSYWWCVGFSVVFTIVSSLIRSVFK